MESDFSGFSVANEGDIANVDDDFDLSDISVSSVCTEDLTDASDFDSSFDSESSNANAVAVDDNTFSNVLQPVVLQPFTHVTGVTHALDDTAIELDFFNLLFTMTC